MPPRLHTGDATVQNCHPIALLELRLQRNQLLLLDRGDWVWTSARAACARPGYFSAEVGPGEAVGAPIIGGESIVRVSSPERRGAVSHSDITAKATIVGNSTLCLVA